MKNRTKEKIIYKYFEHYHYLHEPWLSSQSGPALLCQPQTALFQLHLQDTRRTYTYMSCLKYCRVKCLTSLLQMGNFIVTDLNTFKLASSNSVLETGSRWSLLHLYHHYFFLIFISLWIWLHINLHSSCTLMKTMCLTVQDKKKTC